MRQILPALVGFIANTAARIEAFLPTDNKSIIDLRLSDLSPEMRRLHLICMWMGAVHEQP